MLGRPARGGETGQVSKPLLTWDIWRPPPHRWPPPPGSRQNGVTAGWLWQLAWVGFQFPCWQGGVVVGKGARGVGPEGSGEGCSALASSGSRAHLPGTGQVPEPQTLILAWRGSWAEPWLCREVTLSPSGERSWTYDLGEIGRLRGLDAPRNPTSPAWPWVWLTGHPCSCRETQSSHKWPAALGREASCAALVPRPRWCWVSQGRAPAAHSWQRLGAGNLRRLCPPDPKEGVAHQSLPVFSAPAAICLCPPSGRGGAGPHSCTRPLPTAAFPNLLLPRQAPGTLTQPPGSVWGPPCGVLGCPSSPVPWGPSAMSPTSPGSFVSRTPCTPARVGTSPPRLRASGRPLS